METRTIRRRQLLYTLTAGGLASAFLLGTGPARAVEKHPHIREAVKALKEAKRELKEREKLFGGHAEKALKSVDEAIQQLEKALEFVEKK